MITTLRTHLRRISLLASVAALSLASPASAQVLHFDDVATNAAGFNSSAFTTYGGYSFENFGVMTNATAFGFGTNDTSPPKFAYAHADDASFIYRTDTPFNFFYASLSYRRFDAITTPVDIVVNGYRTGDVNPFFSQVITLTNSAQVFTFHYTDIEEIEFDTHLLDENRAAVLALDDLSVAAVPEPSSIVLLATGLFGVMLVARRRRSA